MQHRNAASDSGQSKQTFCFQLHPQQSNNHTYLGCLDLCRKLIANQSSVDQKHAPMVFLGTQPHFYVIVALALRERGSPPKIESGLLFHVSVLTSFSNTCGQWWGLCLVCQQSIAEGDCPERALSALNPLSSSKSRTLIEVQILQIESSALAAAGVFNGSCSGCSLHPIRSKHCKFAATEYFAGSSM
jgi:hypothetical protein